MGLGFRVQGLGFYCVRLSICGASAIYLRGSRLSMRGVKAALENKNRRHGAPRDAARGGRRAVDPDLAGAHRQGRGHVATALSSLSQPLPCRRARAKALAQSQGHSLCPARATRRPCRRAVRSARRCLDVDKGMRVAGRMRPHPARPGPPQLATGEGEGVDLTKRSRSGGWQ